MSPQVAAGREPVDPLDTHGGGHTSVAAPERGLLSVEPAQVLARLTVKVSDSPGFASSRLGMAPGLEAIRMVQDGVADAADIDRAMTLGYRHPIGPLRLTDLVGLDARLDIADRLRRELGERFQPPRLLREMVAAGHLGVKSGSGFCEWPSESTAQGKDS